MKGENVSTCKNRLDQCETMCFELEILPCFGQPIYGDCKESRSTNLSIFADLI